MLAVQVKDLKLLISKLN